ncbi:unnamed protein product [Phaedon cochleariae]|uniref:AAA+ ATPase domain-containing protein n=1 Tax=Phaedon cochleariae TaxID=80249 RepID=A0A9P0DJ76_PHACE|nr:unnamed protein product [Phaedon cochleariae]
MSAQKQKKTTSPWTLCEKCSVSLLYKDKEAHITDCPPDVNEPIYNFIKKGVLYGTVDQKCNEDVKNLSTRERDNLVFLSESVIRLCSLAIGDWVSVKSLNGSSQVAKIVWPTTEKTLTSVLFTKNGLDLSLFSINQKVIVSKLSSEPRKASCVTLVTLNGPKSLEFSSELYNRISKSHESRILSLGNQIGSMFYGKLLRFEIKSIEVTEASNNQNDLNTNFDRLCIEQPDEVFEVTSHTKWKLYRDQEDFEKNTREEQLTSLAGIEEELSEIRGLMYTCLNKSKISFLYQTKAVLLFGNSGTGKTTIAQTLAQESKANIVTISPPDLFSKNTVSPEENIREMFNNAFQHAPSVIILDEIDVLCPSRSNRLSETEKRVVSTLLLLFDELATNKHQCIFLIATTNKPDNVDPSFRRCGRLDREIEIPTPSPHNRRLILDKLLEKIPNVLSEDDNKDISLNTHGFVGADLVSLCSRAGLHAIKRGAAEVNLEDFKFAMKMVRPSAMREVQIEVPNVKWSDIGGQENLKLILRQAVEWPLKYSDSFLRLGVTPPKGVLMFGPPGCSKTMIAKALATESGLNFLSIKGPELFSKWVGESERAVREVFRKARQVAPSIIFFDEIDALGGERSSNSSTSVQERVLAQLLTELDGVTPLGDVTILAATNRPDRIDKALLRPGRLDRIVYVPLPDKQTRRDIFRIKFEKMPILNVSIEDLVENTESYSGAEVNAVCHEAAMMALEENLESQHVEGRHFEKALKLITPRTPSSLIKLYEDYLQNKI